MIDLTSKRATQDAIEWALVQGLAFKTSAHSASHVAFSFTPTPIARERFEQLKSSVPLLGKLIHGVSENNEFVREAIAPVALGDPFFGALLAMHKQIHSDLIKAAHLPLLIMRSDFMDDGQDGPKLIEFNGIAAGMGPFGQRIHELHRYLRAQWPDSYAAFSDAAQGELISNPAIERLSQGIAQACLQIKQETGEQGAPVFLMIVQADEDNVFDQHLLELALQSKGIKTVRRTFRELYGKLSTGPEARLLLEGIGAIDCVYLRAGYQYDDYAADDIVGRVCCEALIQTRVFIEKHRVAVNATVSQQLATSKRVQMLLTFMSCESLCQFGLKPEEAQAVKGLLGEMRAVNKALLSSFSGYDPLAWVLKNQGEGGGHCVFAQDILPTMDKLKEQEYPAWSLMRRLHPVARAKSALVVRNGVLSTVDDLICEIGMFTVHIDGQPAVDDAGYAGYLIRSKSSTTCEGGIHSGMGVLDSLVFSTDSYCEAGNQ